jgi:hypothetical protein
MNCRAGQAHHIPGVVHLKAKLALSIIAGLFVYTSHCVSQTLNLPPRPPGAPNGTQFTNIIISMGLTERENWIYQQVMIGNVPNFQRALVPINVSGSGHTGKYYVTPDYLAIGTDADYFLEPTTPLLAQRLGNALGYTLPTRKMANQIWTNSTVKMTPQPIPTDPDMITVPYFAQENYMVRTQRNSFTNAHPLGALVSGDKKDVIISSKIYTNFATSITKPVVIYGWFYTSGSPIQPLYNGHEETYADYSHGIRFVQNAMTVDGAANTVTNVLTQPTLAPLLSDEGASEGSTGGVIRKPWYTPEPVALAFITHPRSQTVLPGSTVTLSAFAVGDAPAYRWQRNGLTLAGATGTSLTLSNVQTLQAGSYTVTISNSTGTLASRAAVLKVNTNVHPVLFADSFETNSSSQWNLFWGASDGVPDYTVDWAYDYGVIPYTFNGVTSLIPAAPNSADGVTRGVRFTVNNNDANAATAGVNIYPKLQSFSGNFALKFDLWINYPGNAGGINATGSTEYALCGINHLGTQANWAAPSAPSTDGIWFAADGEGGSTTTDYRCYLGNLSGTQFDLTAAGTSGLIASNNSAAIFQTLFPASRFESAGAPGKNWVEVELRQTNNFVTWLIDGTVIASRANASSFTAGNIMIGFMDPFSSIAIPASKAFVLFDNVRVEDLSGPALAAPNIISQPAATNAYAGDTVTFSVGSAGSAPLSYQWRFNGTNLAAATASALTLPNASTNNAGAYDVIITNAAGLTASAAARLTVSPPPLRFNGATVLPDGQVQFNVSGGLGQTYTVEASTNLVDWATLTTVVITNVPQTLTDTAATNYTSRYYRAR